MVRGGRMIAKCPICGTKMKKTSQSDIYSYYRCKNGHRLLWTPERGWFVWNSKSRKYENVVEE